MDSSHLQHPRLVRCPACGGTARYVADNPFRPFCSARCKGLDLGAWASEDFRVPLEAPADDDSPAPALRH